MKIYYYKAPGGNFGDDLNTFLWPRLMPTAFDGTHQMGLVQHADVRGCQETLFLGIGTIINGLVPQTATKHVFGSGAGYGRIPRLDDKWHIHCVRGPLTANLLGLAPEKAITDPAALIRLLPISAEKQYPHSFMSHSASVESGRWQKICETLGLNFIDVRWPPAKVIESIARTEILITEALHGAIVADALRVPWIPVSSEHIVLTSKWDDWCQTIGIQYAPSRIPTIWKPRAGTAGAIINATKQIHGELALARVLRYASPTLSNEKTLNILVERLLEMLHEFCREQNFRLNTSL